MLSSILLLSPHVREWLIVCVCVCAAERQAALFFYAAWFTHCRSSFKAKKQKKEIEAHDWPTGNIKIISLAEH